MDVQTSKCDCEWSVVGEVVSLFSGKRWSKFSSDWGNFGANPNEQTSQIAI